MAQVLLAKIFINEKYYQIVPAVVCINGFAVIYLVAVVHSISQLNTKTALPFPHRYTVGILEA